MVENTGGEPKSVDDSEAPTVPGPVVESTEPLLPPVGLSWCDRLSVPLRLGLECTHVRVRQCGRRRFRVSGPRVYLRLFVRLLGEVDTGRV